MELDPLLVSAAVAHNEGRVEDEIRVLSALFGQVAEGGARAEEIHFMTMFMWSQLAADSEAARAALVGMRDAQRERLLNGETDLGAQTDGWRCSRFTMIVDLNKMLNDRAATYDLFVRMLALSPDSVQGHAHLALPAIVEAGDFALAERYLGDPLQRLDELNALAQKYPLFPPNDQAPRLAAELFNFMKDVALRTAVLRGLGREDEAASLQSALEPGLAGDEMRALARRELAAPGAIMRELAAHRIAMEGDAPPGHPGSLMAGTPAPGAR